MQRVLQVLLSVDGYIHREHNLIQLRDTGSLDEIQTS